MPSVPTMFGYYYPDAASGAREPGRPSRHHRRPQLRRADRPARTTSSSSTRHRRSRAPARPCSTRRSSTGRARPPQAGRRDDGMDAVRAEHRRVQGARPDVRHRVPVRRDLLRPGRQRHLLAGLDGARSSSTPDAIRAVLVAPRRRGRPDEHARRRRPNSPGQWIVADPAAASGSRATGSAASRARGRSSRTTDRSRSTSSSGACTARHSRPAPSCATTPRRKATRRSPRPAIRGPTERSGRDLLTRQRALHVRWTSHLNAYAPAAQRRDRVGPMRRAR